MMLYSISIRTEKKISLKGYLLRVILISFTTNYLLIYIISELNIPYNHANYHTGTVRDETDKNVLRRSSTEMLKC